MTTSNDVFDILQLLPSIAKVAELGAVIEIVTQSQSNRLRMFLAVSNESRGAIQCARDLLSLDPVFSAFLPRNDPDAWPCPTDIEEAVKSYAQVLSTEQRADVGRHLVAAASLHAALVHAVGVYPLQCSTVTGVRCPSIEDLRSPRVFSTRVWVPSVEHSLVAAKCITSMRLGNVVREQLDRITGTQWENVRKADILARRTGKSPLFLSAGEAVAVFCCSTAQLSKQLELGKLSQQRCEIRRGVYVTAVRVAGCIWPLSTAPCAQIDDCLFLHDEFFITLPSADSLSTALSPLQPSIQPDDILHIGGRVAKVATPGNIFFVVHGPRASNPTRVGNLNFSSPGSGPRKASLSIASSVLDSPKEEISDVRSVVISLLVEHQGLSLTAIQKYLPSVGIADIRTALREVASYSTSTRKYFYINSIEP